MVGLKSIGISKRAPGVFWGVSGHYKQQMNLHRGARCYHGDCHCLMKIRIVGTLMYQMWNTLTRKCLLDKHHDYIMPWRFFLKLLALCEGIPPLINKGPVMWSFDVFLVVLPKNMLNKQSYCQWFQAMMLIWHLHYVLWCYNTEIVFILEWMLLLYDKINSLFSFFFFMCCFFPPTGKCGFVFILVFKIFYNSIKMFNDFEQHHLNMNC